MILLVKMMLAVLSVDSVETVGADAVETVEPEEVDDIVGEDDVACAQC